MKSQLPQLKPRVQLPSIAGKRRAGSVPARGEITFSIPGSYNWIVPNGVTSISDVCIGGGGGGKANGQFSRDISSGGAGGLSWANNLAVSAGDVVVVTVGIAGAGRADSATPAQSGGFSSISLNAVILTKANGGTGGDIGINSPGGTVDTGTGGQGGGGEARNTSSQFAAATGGGTGGYSGNGGNGVSISDGTITGTSAPTGGGGASGSIQTFRAHGSGGVGLFGEGASGVAVALAGGGGGSGGQDGELATTGGGISGQFGAGGSIVNTIDGGNIQGGHGAVRIIWGAGREFPSTDVGQS